MREIGLIKALAMTRRAGKMTPEERAALRRRRLEALVAHARANSPYYAERYTGLGADFALTDLPAVNKVELMARFDDWTADRAVTLARVRAFMEDKDNIGRMLDGKYLVFTTSGSTGHPAVIIWDKTAMNISSALSVLRSYARREDMAAFLKKGKRSASLFADDGFYLGCGSIRYQLHKMPYKKGQIMNIDVRTPMARAVERLNAFRPAMLGGYPSALELLAEEQEAGRLHIAPAVVMTGGELLRPEVRERLGAAFGGYVQTNDSCTEGGTVAHECRNRHFHINDEWIIVEPVDSAGRAVPDGVQSDKLLLTNLASFAQPIIRYEVTDRVILHREPCGCGCTAPWLELEGRTDDTLTFSGGVRAAPLGLYALLKEIPGVRRFQLVQREQDVLELRLLAEDREAAFETARRELGAYLKSLGADVGIVLGEDLPRTHPESGKFRHIMFLGQERGPAAQKL